MLALSAKGEPRNKSLIFFGTTRFVQAFSVKSELKNKSRGWVVFCALCLVPARFTSSDSTNKMLILFATFGASCCCLLSTVNRKIKVWIPFCATCQRWNEKNVKTKKKKRALRVTPSLIKQERKESWLVWALCKPVRWTGKAVSFLWALDALCCVCLIAFCL